MVGERGGWEREDMWVKEGSRKFFCSRGELGDWRMLRSGDGKKMVVKKLLHHLNDSITRLAYPRFSTTTQSYHITEQPKSSGRKCD